MSTAIALIVLGLIAAAFFAVGVVHGTTRHVRDVLNGDAHEWECTDPADVMFGEPDTGEELPR